MFDLTGKVAVVTGGARGIGRTIAAALAGQGAHVAIIDLNLPLAEEVANELAALGHRTLARRADVSDYAQMKQAISEVLAAFGRIDILVNNAAILSTTPFLELTEEEWDRVIAVDLKSVFNSCQAVLDSMIEQGGGKIINIASIAGKRGGGFLGNSVYSAAKAGVIGLSKALARELAPYGINVNAVAPGLTETPMTAWASNDVRRRILSNVPLGRIGQPEDVAAAVVFLASDEASFITGEVLDVDGGVTMD